ncbi:hypothetical protein CCR94_02420 [Rhodoblastus sphagnicola]|uniref:DUF2726 domain-containing protein n=1 Tax=Rhodoblastus sphagnicola TaxID=333368 RepID=A0A2S6NF52_9HYPH|nr:DUF2726 domain-containing protein [Rhodoblastus sphagnicola]MBB4200238.1 very-short-patch-repair endonuclease [Rhodoblastus sphagnicola]PPQ33275.1 hypothetical protein CCR94_02420 [Rhodoblastus sphagnicola]
MVDQLMSASVVVLVVGVIILGLSEVVAFARGGRRNGFSLWSEKARYCRGRFLSRNEKEFLSKLDRVVSARYRVFAQVRLADLVDVEGSKGARFDMMRPVFGKSVDFVVCDRATLDPVMVLEVDDRTHDASDRRGRDALVNRVCAEAGLRLVRVRARFAYSEIGLGQLLQANGLALASFPPNVAKQGPVIPGLIVSSNK